MGGRFRQQKRGGGGGAVWGLEKVEMGREGLMYCPLADGWSPGIITPVCDKGGWQAWGKGGRIEGF